MTTSLEQQLQEFREQWPILLRPKNKKDVINCTFTVEAFLKEALTTAEKRGAEKGLNYAKAVVNAWRPRNNPNIMHDSDRADGLEQMIDSIEKRLSSFVHPNDTSV